MVLKRLRLWAGLAGLLALLFVPAAVTGATNGDFNKEWAEPLQKAAKRPVGVKHVASTYLLVA